ncbi:response regulator [Pedobacter punctiformis]|uniref:histidine kinase n=1 Tax=Pedobacter punctiformis TaxID=3004097 RepID=A0ABT4L3W0_9SPHI|nr:response regulator [Pedobacter sp. HCMS5-2]MCZ4242608.1 response regulator [Pedobacter sp. HCMS5-2]
MDKLNLLIVDDKQENIVALEALLHQHDINIVTTTSPNEALRICWEKDIAIALVDVQMPGMDGFELVEILKNNPRTQEIMVIFVTAISVETKYAIKGLNVGAVDYLYKPLDPYITSAKVDSFVQLVRNQREIKRKNIQLEHFQDELIKAKEEAEQGKRAKENFLANMSHEIRTPINGIIGLVHLLEKSPLNESQKEIIELLSVSSDSLLGVINDILDISKIEAGKFRINFAETDIRQLIQQAINLLNIRAKEKHIDLILEIDENLPYIIIADSLRLNQILMNLLSNAIKFTSEGSVTLKVEVVNKKSNNAQINFSITDTGIGISQDNLSKIFESFEQAEDQTIAKYGGTGLGLSIVKKLAELKGGLLNVVSEEGKGSTFSFTRWYEFVEGKSVEKEVVEPDFLTSLKGIRILVAEDNPINKFLIVKLLDSWDAETMVVENGQEALDILKDNDYDIILMDTYMPVMNGLEAIKRIRLGHIPGKNKIPIITFSAGVLDKDKETAIKAGANDVVGKPFKVNVLHQKIKLYANKTKH